MSLLRAFIALEIPPQTRSLLEQQVASLRRTLGDDIIRWVPPENMHLTLKFLGDVSNSHINFLKQMISQSADLHSTFDIQVGGLGCFPNARAPRILWVGLHAPPVLSSLQKNIEAGSVRLGYEAEERAFSPHLTIGRMRQNSNPADLPKVRAALNSAQVGKMEIAHIDSIHLFKSDLHPGGSIYTKLFSALLKK